MVQWKYTGLWYLTRALIFQNSFSSCDHKYQDVTSSIKLSSSPFRLSQLSIVRVEFREQQQQKDDAGVRRFRKEILEGAYKGSRASDKAKNIIFQLAYSEVLKSAYIPTRSVV